MSSLHNLATNPYQYDNVGNDWLNEGAKETPWRLFFKETLLEKLHGLHGLSVLDVGCGTGWTAEFFSKLGAKSYVGIEPSKLNFATAKSSYKNAEFINSSFEKFDSNQIFDLITCLMASEHLGDLNGAFIKWHKLLRPRGRLLIIAGDFEAFGMEKFNYQIGIDFISDSEFLVQTKRPDSVDIVDIIRKPTVYLSAAKAAGFTESLVIPMTASTTLINRLPQYELFRQKPIFQLLIFGKNWGEL